ncbi:hypothetical protein CTheo_6238 [Ceratobasidium theobromae]|uniref:Uncharacterized protein n=1 Tax=Ceratobasidium theobromae TaxID=1582974 RepID=A0A5N5QFL4_9AGAM|nr:hypothetical protein CTheo_6238 [Ceratobasidium theobromae]
MRANTRSIQRTVHAGSPPQTIPVEFSFSPRKLPVPPDSWFPNLQLATSAGTILNTRHQATHTAQIPSLKPPSSMPIQSAWHARSNAQTNPFQFRPPHLDTPPNPERIKRASFTVRGGSD